jgi:hypothetical protein
MYARLATAVFASLVASSIPVQAQTHSDRALVYLQGQWYSGNGELIDFYITRDIPKFTHTVSPTKIYTGSYRAGEAGADYVLEYPTGLKCYYDVRFGSGSDQKEIVFALRRAAPEGGEKICIQGPLHRQADRR